MKLQLILSLLVFTTNEYKINIIGDWGNPLVTDPYQPCDKQQRVAKVFNSLPDDYHFTISLGDNFYPEGVVDEYDQKFKYLWEDVYLDKKPWYIIAGNHDYYGNVTAELEYAKKSTKWIYPSKYYDMYIGEVDAYFIFLDTEILSNTTQSITQDEKIAQMMWFENTLKQAQNSSWIIVVGHYNIYSGESRPEFDQYMKSDVLPLLKKYKVNMYICGHNHISEYIFTEQISFIVNGDGGRDQTDVYNPNTLPKAIFYNSDNFGSVSQLEFVDRNRLEITYFLADSHEQIVSTFLRNVRSNK